MAALLHPSRSIITISLLLFVSTATADQVQYLINCGSGDNGTLPDGRNFIGDVKPRNFKLSGHRSRTLKSANQSDANSPYATARVFEAQSVYHLNIPQNGTCILRLHFYPFSSSPELASAQFNVSASTHLLLSNFKADNPISKTFKEFLFKVDQGDLRIRFTPQSESLAFVNAIEVFLVDMSITDDSPHPDVSAEGRNGNYTLEKSRVLETIYRLNVGASEIQSPQDNHNSWRTWIPDDPFFITKDHAQNATVQSTGINYPDSNQVSADYAPDYVYETAKEFRNSSSNIVSDLTWHFNVTKWARYFARVHFCDIVSAAANPYTFTFNVYSNFSQKIDPRSEVGMTGIPFYKDFIVESRDFGVLNISIGPSLDSKNKNKAFMFLNGLEILQIKNEAAPDPNDSGSSHLAVIVGSVVGGVAFVVGVLMGVVFLHRRKRKTEPAELFEWGLAPLNAGTSSDNRIPDRSSSARMSNLSNLHLGLKIPFSEIQLVTNNFDSLLIVGEGGFGKVYKGTLRNGLKVAVKRSNSDHGQGLSEFQTEIMVLSKIRHYHLVSLIGYCYEQDEMILVYEFMEKGPLKDHLYDPRAKTRSSSRVGLSWKQRLEICIGSAKGLHYLHTGLDSGIIHRDVKSTNILLDQNFIAKVADFGLSRSQHLEKTHVSTEVKGTFGYLDPEYFNCLQLTEKSDVYSFGVVLLEVLCARTVIDPSLPRDRINLVEWVTTCHRDGSLETVIDPMIVGQISPSSLKRFVETAMKCLNELAVERPSMADVLWDLEYALQLQKMAARGNIQDESMTDASMSLPFPVVTRRLPSQSFAEEDESVSALLEDTATGEVFSQLSFENDGGR